MCRFRYYNPRASWVLKRTTSNKFSNSPLLQPTCIVGTKTIVPQRSGSVKELQPTCIVGTKTIVPQRSGSVKELQPTCIVGTKTFLFHSDSFAPIDYNPRTSRVLKPLSIHSATPTQTTAHVYCGD